MKSNTVKILSLFINLIYNRMKHKVIATTLTNRNGRVIFYLF